MPRLRPCWVVSRSQHLRVMYPVQTVRCVITPSDTVDQQCWFCVTPSLTVLQYIVFSASVRTACKSSDHKNCNSNYLWANQMAVGCQVLLEHHTSEHWRSNKFIKLQYTRCVRKKMPPPPKHVQIPLWIENDSHYFSFTKSHLFAMFVWNFTTNSLSIAEILLFIKRWSKIAVANIAN